jgi:multiple sugar transport system permease protein
MLVGKRLLINKPSLKLREIILLIIMSLFALFMVSPVLWLLSASFQNQSNIFKAYFNWIPGELMFSNYVEDLTTAKLGTAFFNSDLVTAIYIPIHILLCSLTGYIFAKFNFRFKNFLFLFILLTMLIPQETTYFSVYNIVKILGWLNTPQGVVLPYFYSGFGIFMMRQFALSIPTELLEASKLDGCSNLRSFFSIALPLLKPGVSALAILALSFIWNEFAWSKLVLSSSTSQTLPIALYFLSHSAVTDHVVNYSALIAASVIAALPILVLFLLFQRQFIESISTVGIKG